MRNNEKRLGVNQGQSLPEDAAAATQTAQQPAAPGLSFVVPTEFVELPSSGRFYPEDHPLHNKEVVEIKYMTAKEEDILTSTSLIKRGLAIERLLANILVDKKIDTQSLLAGDRNAILVAARASGYGKVYETSIGCPSCGDVSNHVFDLGKSSLMQRCFDEEFLKEKEIELSDNIFYVTFPKTQVRVGVKLLTGKDEVYLMNVKKKRKSSDSETAVTDQLSSMIVSLNNETDSWNIRRFIEALPISDSQYVRNTYKQIVPNLDLTQTFSCMRCGHVQDMEVPFNTEFFWPNQ
jgi:hypothetical protein